MGYELWVMGYELWVMGYGLWVMSYELWVMRDDVVKFEGNGLIEFPTKWQSNFNGLASTSLV